MPRKPQFDARKMMEKAIEVMKESINEQRTDGKASPLVGAVLVKPDGSVETASRGELREGDHAEFTLLERKNRANKLDGAFLFATLEPCAPGARNHPKLSCAERIVNARIKEVWVGHPDPDPTVDRKGIKFLQDHGVTVHMFDPDLQEEIKAANEMFIHQAIERREESEKAAKDVVLSALENPVPHVNLDEFSQEALERHRASMKIEEEVTSERFRRKLVQQGLVKLKEKKAEPSGFGLLLFGESPRDAIPQAGLLGTIHYPDGSEETRDFDGPLIFIPEQAIQWLKDKLPNPIDRSDARRKEVHESFYQLVREGIANALVHRNYEILGAKCQLVVKPESITIKSPGEPVSPITLEQLQDFNAPMLSRNPILHYVFAKLDLAEERGLGLKTLRSRASALSLPLPTYRWEDPYLVLTLYRSEGGVVADLAPEVRESLNEDEKACWAFVSSRESVTNSEVMAEMGFDERKAQRVLKSLQAADLVQRVGRGPATRYRVSHS